MGETPDSGESAMSMAAVDGSGNGKCGGGSEMQRRVACPEECV